MEIVWKAISYPMIEIMESAGTVVLLIRSTHIVGTSERTVGVFRSTRSYEGETGKDYPNIRNIWKPDDTGRWIKGTWFDDETRDWGRHVLD